MNGTIRCGRRSIDVPGLGHGTNPIPAASRVGPFIATGGIRGVDVATGQMPATLGDQVDHMFGNLKRVLGAAGATLDAVIKITLWTRTADSRPAINAGWLKHFPDPASRPARHLQVHDLGHGMLVQCEALAVIHPYPEQTPT